MNPLAWHPTYKFPPEILLKAQGEGELPGMKAAIFDVDGVLTDGSLYISEHGECLKAFHSLDGHGLKLLAQAGVCPLVITGRDSPALRQRLSELGIQHALYGVKDKLTAAESLLHTLKISWPQVAAMGDDWPDLPIMVRAAFAMAPANAHAEVKACAHHVSTLRGGEGAARECCDILLMASGRYAELLREHITPQGRTMP